MLIIQSDSCFHPDIPLQGVQYPAPHVLASSTACAYQQHHTCRASAHRQKTGRGVLHDYLHDISQGSDEPDRVRQRAPQPVRTPPFHHLLNEAGLYQARNHISMLIQSRCGHATRQCLLPAVEAEARSSSWLQLLCPQLTCCSY